MRKKYFYLTLMLIVFLLSLNIKVEAADTCSTSELNELKAEASSITASYELDVMDNSDYIQPNSYFYTIVLYDVTDNFYYKVADIDYSYSSSKNNIITIADAFSSGGVKVKIEIYASTKTNCSETLIRTISLDLPYYNKYSTYDECVGYEELEICSSTSNTENVTTDEQFLTLLETEKEEATKIEEKEERNDSILEKIIDFYLEYKEITIPLTIIIVLLLVIITIILVRNNKKKIKIDLGGKI